MKKSKNKYWSLFWKFRKLHLMRFMEYRSDFIFWMVISTLWTIFNFFFFTILVNIRGEIAGWNRNELYLLLGVFTLNDAFTWSFFYHNMQNYTQMIFNGNLNNYLVRPIDTQYLLMTSYNNYTNLPRFVIGIGTIVWSVNQQQLSLSIWEVVFFLFLFFISLIFIYFLWFCVATLTFYFDKLDNINEVIPTLREVYKLPRSVYVGIFSTLLTVVIPLGLVSSLPSEVLLQKVSVSWSFYFVLFTLGLIFLSRWFFKISLKKYSGIAN